MEAHADTHAADSLLAIPSTPKLRWDEVELAASLRRPCLKEEAVCFCALDHQLRLRQRRRLLDFLNTSRHLCSNPQLKHQLPPIFRKTENRHGGCLQKRLYCQPKLALILQARGISQVADFRNENHQSVHHNVDPPGASFLRPTKKVASMLVQRGAEDVKMNLPKDHMSLTPDGLQPDDSIDNTMEDAPIQDEIQWEIQLLDLHSRGCDLYICSGVLRC